jgi:putative tryptophan/tyrosine transport system substrate-binding protein
VKRRDFMALTGGAVAAWPFAASAQAQPIRRVGVLGILAETDPQVRFRHARFQEGLEKSGWIEGRNIHVDYRYAASDIARIEAYATELVGLAPDVILGQSTPVLAALMKLTRSLPIIFVEVSDPVDAGFVPSLAKPGGNITGFSNFEYTISGKWLELLKEAAPDTKRVAVLLFRGDPSWSRYLAPVEASAPSLGIQITRIFLGEAKDTERDISAFAQEPDSGLITTNNPRAYLQRELICKLAIQHRRPAIYPSRIYTTSDGLMSYGIDNSELYWHAASYVDRILRGEQPGDLPVQQPTKFELMINVKTAKAIDLAIPPGLTLRADEIIE